MTVFVSVIVCARNEQEHIGQCVKSILEQSFQDFELLIVDDQSTDRTREIVESFGDKRIRYLFNKKWLGISGSRNKGIINSKGSYVFFTDADCVVNRDWISEGLKYLGDEKCVGVEGAIIYVSDRYTPTFSDYVMENKHGKKYMTGNIAFKKLVFDKIGLYDENLSYFEDREFALRILNKKIGQIYFSAEMKVYHPRVTMSYKIYLKLASRNKNRPYLFKRYGDQECLIGHFFQPFNLAKIFFPLLILVSLFYNKFQRYDYKLLPFSYFFSVKERILFWRECVRARAFLI